MCPKLSSANFSWKPESDHRCYAKAHNPSEVQDQDKIVQDLQSEIEALRDKLKVQTTLDSKSPSRKMSKGQEEHDVHRAESMHAEKQARREAEEVSVGQDDVEMNAAASNPAKKLF